MKDYLDFLKKWCKSIYVKIALIGIPFLPTVHEMRLENILAGKESPILNILYYAYGVVVCIATGGTAFPLFSASLNITESGGDGGGSGKVGEVTIDGETYDLYRRSAVPYSRIEKAASQISAAIYDQRESGFPVVIAESRDAYQAVSSVLGSSVSSALNALDVLEKTLSI